MMDMLRSCCSSSNRKTGQQPQLSREVVSSKSSKIAQSKSSPGVGAGAAIQRAGRDDSIEDVEKNPQALLAALAQQLAAVAAANGEDEEVTIPEDDQQQQMGLEHMLLSGLAGENDKLPESRAELIAVLEGKHEHVLMQHVLLKSMLTELTDAGDSSMPMENPLIEILSLMKSAIESVDYIEQISDPAARKRAILNDPRFAIADEIESVRRLSTRRSSHITTSTTSPKKIVPVLMNGKDGKSGVVNLVPKQQLSAVISSKGSDEQQGGYETPSTQGIIATTTTATTPEDLVVPNAAATLNRLLQKRRASSIKRNGSLISVTPTNVPTTADWLMNVLQPPQVLPPSSLPGGGEGGTAERGGGAVGGGVGGERREGGPELVLSSVIRRNSNNIEAALACRSRHSKVANFIPPALREKSAIALNIAHIIARATKNGLVIVTLFASIHVAKAVSLLSSKLLSGLNSLRNNASSKKPS